MFLHITLSVKESRALSLIWLSMRLVCYMDIAVFPTKDDSIHKFFLRNNNSYYYMKS